MSHGLTLRTCQPLLYLSAVCSTSLLIPAGMGIPSITLRNQSRATRGASPSRLASPHPGVSSSRPRGADLGAEASDARGVGDAGRAGAHPRSRGGLLAPPRSATPKRYRPALRARAPRGSPCRPGLLQVPPCAGVLEGHLPGLRVEGDGASGVYQVDRRSPLGLRVDVRGPGVAVVTELSRSAPFVLVAVG